MRIIVERDAASQWHAWWADQPEETFGSASIFGAVVKLLAKSGEARGVSTDDLRMDFHASGGNHIEMFVKPRLSQKNEKLTGSFIAKGADGTEIHAPHFYHV